jgi:hypothetical protein
MRVFTASRALRIAVEAKFIEFTGQRIVGHKASHQWITQAKQQLNGLGGL